MKAPFAIAIATAPERGSQPDTARVPDAMYRMEADRNLLDQAPAHHVGMDACWVGATAPTNAQSGCINETHGHAIFREVLPHATNHAGTNSAMLVARPAARFSPSPDGSTAPLGFRCVVRDATPGE